MTILFVILVILAAVILGLIVLIQNPKGGGLAGNIAGFSNQFMGVKQTTDVLEKGTWIFAAVIGVLCLISTVFISSKAKTSGTLENVGSSPAVTAPATGLGTTPGAVPTGSGSTPPTTSQTP